MGTNELDKEQTIYEQLAQRCPLNFCEYFGFVVSVVHFSSGASFQLKYLKITVVGHTLDKFSRKNDTTRWFYMLLHMYGGPLGLKTKEEALRSCPNEFSCIHELIDALQPHQRPEYEKIKEHLHGCLCRLRIQEFPYDWEEGAKRWSLLPSSSEK
ncbi:hypothetical protein GPALN_003318 [Globodera pallida]|nr:hypothetical protein GPALN_003318 [Globodera pallida]